MWSVIARRQWVEVTGDGTEAVTDPVALDPEPGWGGGIPLPAEVEGNRAMWKHSVGHPPPNTIPQQSHPL